MSTKHKKRKRPKVVEESKSESVRTNDLVDSHDLPTNDVTLVSTLTEKPVDKLLDCKATSKKKDKISTQPKDNSKNDVNPASTLENDIKWCIAQLEMAIVNKSVPKKQKEENIKYIKLLQSSKTPVPRKRQIMRQNFGDYKQKMREKPLLDNDITLKVADSELLESAGKFCRKSAKFQANFHVDENDDGQLQGPIGGDVEYSDGQSLKELCKELENAPFAFNFSID